MRRQRGQASRAFDDIQKSAVGSLVDSVKSEGCALCSRAIYQRRIKYESVSQSNLTDHGRFFSCVTSLWSSDDQEIISIITDARTSFVICFAMRSNRHKIMTYYFLFTKCYSDTPKSML